MHFLLQNPPFPLTRYSRDMQLNIEWDWEWHWEREERQRQEAETHARRQIRKSLHRKLLLLALPFLLAGGLLAVPGAEQPQGQAQAEKSKPMPAKNLGWLPAQTPYRDLILRAAARTGMEPALLAGLVETESDFQPETLSSAGAYGLTQLMPESAEAVGVPWQGTIWQQLLGGAREYMMHWRQFQSTELALAAYNAGPGAVQKYGGIPPYSETQAYVPRVLEFRKKYLRP